MDPGLAKWLLIAVFNAGMIYGGIKAGQKQNRETINRQARKITRLQQYKTWSHRTLSVLISFHRLNHPGQFNIDDWNEIDEGTNGGSNGDN
jgi:hypothetical protein